MKLHKIILTDETIDIPGYEERPWNDLTFFFDPTRASVEEVEELVRLTEEDNVEENDNLETIRRKCDWFPDTSALDLSES
jgi:hypothetical protein